MFQAGMLRVLGAKCASEGWRWGGDLGAAGWNLQGPDCANIRGEIALTYVWAAEWFRAGAPQVRMSPADVNAALAISGHPLPPGFVPVSSTVLIVFEPPSILLYGARGPEPVRVVLAMRRVERWAYIAVGHTQQLYELCLTAGELGNGKPRGLPGPTFTTLQVADLDTRAMATIRGILPAVCDGSRVS